MRDGESDYGKEQEVARVPSSDFARFAGTDLDRWRELAGSRVRHVHPAWGDGRVTDVRWGTPVEEVPCYVQLRIAYDADLSTITNAGSFAETFSEVELPRPLADLVGTCLDPDVDPEVRDQRLASYETRLRERRDEERLARVEAMRRRAAKRP